MNNMTKIGLALIALGGFTSSCVGPLAFQNPASARQAPGFQNKRFGSRPTMQQEPIYMNPGPTAGLQPQSALQLAQSSPRPMRPASQQPFQGAGADLLGWSGEVAAGSGEGQTRLASGQAKHGLEPQITGRMHILNLYQEVLDERDSLLVELQRLNSALREGEQLLTQLRASEKEYGGRLAALEEIKRTLVTQNRDLSGRLTVAQIRRLESDKLLLETQIAMHSSAAELALDGVLEPMLVTEK